MTDSGRSLGRQISELLELMRQYGPEDVAGTIEKAAAVPEISASRRPSSCSPIWSWIPPGPSSADSSTRVCRRSPASRCVAGGHPRAVAQRRAIRLWSLHCICLGNQAVQTERRLAEPGTRAMMGKTPELSNRLRCEDGGQRFTALLLAASLPRWQVAPESVA